MERLVRPDDHIMPGECKVLFEKNNQEHGQFNEHIKESAEFRDMMARHDEQIKMIIGIPRAIWTSTGITLVVIVICALGIGRYLQKVDALEEKIMNKEKVAYHFQ